MKVIFLVSVAVVNFAFANDCPRTDLKETDLDCPYAAIVRELERPDVSIEKGLAKHAPEIKKMIEKDAKSAALKEAWGLSVNYDELVKATIVAPEILDALLKWGKAPAREDRVAHAGIEHTYGYLFSNLQTSFGYKRSRWVGGSVEDGFGLPKGILGPKTKEGTLLGNVTGFLTSLTNRGDVSAKPFRDKRLVAKPIAQFSYDKLTVLRLAEAVKTETGRTVEIRTDLVEFLKSPSPLDANTHLLIYSYRDSRLSQPKLITAFPVGQSFVAGLVQASKEKHVVKTRYNAFIPGITDAKTTWEVQPEAKAL